MVGATAIVTTRGSGDGRPIVLVHGVGLDHTMWDATVELLADDRSGPNPIVRYDLFGHGDSADPAGPRGFEDFVDQLMAVMDQITEDSGVWPDAVGLSLGGTIVRGAAARRPGRFGRVVISNTVFRRTREQHRGVVERLQLAELKGMAPVADLAIERWFTRHWQDRNPDVTEAIRRRLATTDLSGYLKAYRVFADDDPTMPDGLPRLTNDTLVITGDRDTGSTPEMARTMAGLLPNSSVVVMADTGHLAPVEQPTEYARHLLDFLEKPHEPII